LAQALKDEIVATAQALQEELKEVQGMATELMFSYTAASLKTERDAVLPSMVQEMED
jgi:hypothetical protein